MRKFTTALLFLWLALPPAFAQDGTAVSTVRAASAAILAEGTQGLRISWLGTGSVAGEMLDATFSNEGKEALTVRMTPGMVLGDSSGKAQPIMLEDNLEFTVLPGQLTSVSLRGYCLDFQLDPPAEGEGADYQVATDVTRYEPAIRALYAGLRLDRDGKFKPVIQPLQHRTIVIQRALWATLGGENPSTAEKLDSDLRADSAEAGLQFSADKVKYLSEGIWRDVEQTRAEAARE